MRRSASTAGRPRPASSTSTATTWPTPTPNRSAGPFCPPRVVVEPAEQAEVEQDEPSVRGEAARSRGAGRRGRCRAPVICRTYAREKLAGERLRRARGRARAESVTFTPSDALQHEHALGDVRLHDARDDQVLRSRTRARRSPPSRAPPRRSRAPRARCDSSSSAERGELQQPVRSPSAPRPSRGDRPQQLEVERGPPSTIPRPAHLDDHVAPGAAGARRGSGRSRRRRSAPRSMPGEGSASPISASIACCTSTKATAGSVVDEPRELLDVRSGSRSGRDESSCPQLDVGSCRAPPESGGTRGPLRPWRVAPCRPRRPRAGRGAGARAARDARDFERAARAACPPAHRRNVPVRKMPETRRASLEQVLLDGLELAHRERALELRPDHAVARRRRT